MGGEEGVVEEGGERKFPFSRMYGVGDVASRVWIGFTAITLGQLAIWLTFTVCEVQTGCRFSVKSSIHLCW